MSDDGNAPRAVWRRAAAAPRVAEDGPPLKCGGPELSVEERYQLMKARRLARKAEQERELEEAEAKKSRKPASSDKDDEDEDKAAERFRNDRYAVKLLQQDDSAWGGGVGNSGMIG